MVTGTLTPLQELIIDRRQSAMKTLYIIRGLPGAGKTTLAHQLCPRWHPLKRAIAADDCPNRYLSNGTINPDVPHQVAHNWVRIKVERWMRTGWITTIAIHNVSHIIDHMEPYLALAAKYGWSVQVVHAEGVLLPSGSLAQSVHGSIPTEDIDRWRTTWEPWCTSSAKVEYALICDHVVRFLRQEKDVFIYLELEKPHRPWRFRHRPLDHDLTPANDEAIAQVMTAAKERLSSYPELQNMTRDELIVALSNEAYDSDLFAGYLSEIYCHITNGRISKPGVSPDTVIDEMERIRRKQENDDDA